MLGWLMLVYFGSGCCSLIDEVIWVRLLKQILGNTVYASSIVVSVFMGGLALGALWMARHADRVKNRLRLYAIIECLVTASALLLPLAFAGVDHLYVWFYRTFEPGQAGLLLVQTLVSAVILLVPTVLMGSTLPLIGRSLTGLQREAGHLVGRLYALNTLGAAVGCFAAGFVLLRALGVMGALVAAAGLNLVVAVGGYVLSRLRAEPEASEAAAPQPGPAPARGDWRFRVLVAALFVSGLVSISYEILWMRSIVHLLGGYTYVFSAVLTVYLLGNVLGAGLASGFIKRLRRPALGFGVTLFLLGVFGVLYLPLMVFWTLHGGVAMNAGIDALSSVLPISPLLTRPMIHSLCLFLLPALVMGIGFPIALQAYVDRRREVGASTGSAYGANTIGAVLGGLLTGFVLIPGLGVQLSTALLALLAVWLGAALWWTFWGGERGRLRWVGPAAALLLSLTAALLPGGLFTTVVATVHDDPKLELLAVHEGVTTTVSVHRNRETRSLVLYSSGQSLAGDNTTARGDQKMMGHLGLMLHERAGRVLSVGYGSGETTRCLSLHRPARIDCVEIAPEVVEVALQYFRHLNLGDRLRELVNLIFMDAKNYLHLASASYDLIVNDSIHPRTFAENASLYTREYFEDARARLAPGGLFMSWVPTYQMPERVMRSILGTLREVFPHLTVWFLTPHPAPLVLVVASVDPQTYRPAHIEARLADPAIRASLAGINIFDSLDLLSCYVGDEVDLAPALEGYETNSDGHPFIEFLTDPQARGWEILTWYVLDVRARSLERHLDLSGLDEAAQAAWRARYAQLYDVLTQIMPDRMSMQDHSRLPVFEPPPAEPTGGPGGVAP